MTEEQVFLAALDLPSADHRSAYLDTVCGKDTEFRRQVEELLAAHFKSGDFLNEPIGRQLGTDSTPPTIAETLYVRGDLEKAAMPNEQIPADAPDDLQFLLPATRPDSLGRIGHYEVLQVLGKGGFGIVFRAFDDVLQRVVALKVLAPAIAATSPARKRFLREAQASARVRHENVVQVHAVEELPIPYLVMEFIGGETLQQRLDRNGPLQTAEIVSLSRQIAEGLAAAHATGLIHRDIKPGNVLIESGAGERVKITDFGLARAADDASMTQSGVVAGTPMFMAPEQAQGDQLDQRADLFSLGSVMYAMAAGRPPFRAATMFAVLKRVVEESPRPIKDLIPETPQWLCDIISKLHAKNPDDRFQSAREVADVLADWEAQLKANSKLKGFSRIPRSKASATGKSGQRKWTAAAAVLLLPLLALAMTEFVGVTHLFRQQAKTNPIELAGDATPTTVAKHEPPPPTFKNNLGMEFVIVPKGKSWLGGGKDKPGDKDVEIPADFYLGKYEVTQEEWEKVMGENPSHFSRTGGGKDAVKDVSDADLKRFPVERVSWDQCQLFVTKLNEREKETGWVYRLPTEVEWEYACRGGPLSDKADSAFEFYFAEPSNTLPAEQANFDRGVTRTCKVGSYAANRLGLFDMHGSVWEWCEDAVTGLAGDTRRVRRGGGWITDYGSCRAAHRDWHPPSVRAGDMGLRLARVPSAAPSPEAKPPSGDPDRRAAEYVLSVGCSVGVDDTLRRITRAADLPPDAFRLTWVSGANNQVTDAGLAVFKGCTNLKDLSLGCPKLTDAGLAHFKECKDLKMLALGAPVGDAGMAHFKDCKNLLALDLKRTKVSDAGLAHFNGCTKLTTLFLAGPLVGDAGLGHFQECKQLQKLQLSATRVSDAGLGCVKAWPNLMYIDLSDTKVSDTGLAHLAGLDKLTVLHLIRTTVTTSGVEGLAKALPKCRITWDGDTIEPTVKAVAPFTDADVTRIAALPAEQQVEEVRKELVRRNPGFEGKLETKIEDGVVAEFKIVTDHVTDISPIRVFNALRVLECNGTWTVKGPNGLLADLTPLAGMNLAGLTRLNLNHTKVGDAGLAAFQGCKNLTALHLENTAVTDTGLAQLKGCLALTWLEISRTGVTDLSLLKEMPLKHLNCDFRPERDAEILRSIKTLETINGKPAAEFWKEVQKK